MKGSQVIGSSTGVHIQADRAIAHQTAKAENHCVRCNPPEPEEEILVSMCLAGDQQAWSDLVNRYRGLVYTIAARFGASREDAADIYQSVCIEVFNNLAQLKNAQSLRSWLITVAVRQAFRWRKRQGNEVPLETIEPDAVPQITVTPDMPRRVWQTQQERIVREGVAQLPQRSAEMLRLLFFEQPPLPYEEVARRLGLATGSIGFIRGRALNKLRKILSEAGVDGQS